MKQFWILDFGFWTKAARRTVRGERSLLSRRSNLQSQIQNPKSAWPLLALLLAQLLGIVLAAQLPTNIALDLGADKGSTRADAFAHDFYPPETRGGASFRWSHAQSSIALPGLGARPLAIELSVLAHRAQFSDLAHPTSLTLSANGHPQTIALRREAARYVVLVPEAWMAGGSLDLLISTPPWRAPGDSRPELGVALEQVQVRGVGPALGHLPHPPTTLTWLAALLACWLALRLAGSAPRLALPLCLPLVVAPVLGGALDPARLALGNTPLLLGVGWGLALFAALHWALPPLFRWLRLPAAPAALRWVALLAGVSFALRYGGRAYPGSMHGDLELHWHRYARVISGEVYILAAHRGLPFPFPGALYTLVAPFTLLGAPPWVAFEWGMALLEATTPLLLALIAARCWHNVWAGVVAGAVYAAMAGGFMTTWFAFETHIFAQWSMLLLWAALLLSWPQPGEERLGLARGARAGALGLLVVAQSWVYLGHTGFLLNTVTLAAVGVPLLLWQTRRSLYRRAALEVAGATLAGGLLVAAIYYSAFLPLILGQLGGVASVGLLEVTGRRPVAPSETLRAIWQDGILTHYGFFPLPLALVGLALLRREKRDARQGNKETQDARQGDKETRDKETRRREARGARRETRAVVVAPAEGSQRPQHSPQHTRLSTHASAHTPQRLLWWLLALTFLVSMSQAALPFVTRSTLTTRYLMFAAWAVALAASPALLRLWRRGRAGRIAVLAMAIFVVWGTLALWAGAMLYNFAPPEPF